MSIAVLVDGEFGLPELRRISQRFAAGKLSKPVLVAGTTLMLRSRFPQSCQLYGPTRASDLSLCIADTSLWCFVGPSGCASRRCLRIIAGLDPITSGSSSSADKRCQRIPAAHRDIAHGVFQIRALSSYSGLRPHGLCARTARHAELEIDAKVAAGGSCARENLSRSIATQGTLLRRPARVAWPAIVPRPRRCFCFDEPLMNLDAKPAR